jgi:RHS repeat-associated protein
MKSNRRHEPELARFRRPRGRFMRVQDQHWRRTSNNTDFERVYPVRYKRASARAFGIGQMRWCGEGGFPSLSHRVQHGFGTPRCMIGNFGNRSSSSYEWETLFAAYRYDLESGLYQVRFRYLHLKLGRWGSRDPIAENGGINLYGFAGNNSVNRIDIDGRLWQFLRRCFGRTSRRGGGLGGFFHNPSHWTLVHTDVVYGDDCECEYLICAYSRWSARWDDELGREEFTDATAECYEGCPCVLDDPSNPEPGDWFDAPPNKFR